MMNKTKKIKIIVTTILFFVTVVAGLLLTLSLTKTSHCMHINAPSRIVVYHNNSASNKVFETGDKEYNEIYSLVLNSYKQSTLSAILSGNIFKDIKIINDNESVVDFKGFKINFVYDIPQSVRYKNKVYTSGQQSYWYQSLIFNVNSLDSFKYNTVAIIPPENDANYSSQYSYTLRYEVYSNFSNTHDYCLNLFS